MYDIKFTSSCRLKNRISKKITAKDNIANTRPFPLLQVRKKIAKDRFKNKNLSNSFVK